MQFFLPAQLKNDPPMADHPEEPLRRRRISKGFSLPELLLVISAVGFLVLLLGSIPNSINLIGRSRHQSIAREIIAKAIEDKRASAYINLSLGETSINDQRINLLPDGTGKILVEDCNPVNNPAICPNSENVKLITVTVNWKAAGKNQEAKVKTIFAEGGLNQ